jgi:hypothetical protein
MMMMITIIIIIIIMSNVGQDSSIRTLIGHNQKDGIVMTASTGLLSSDLPHYL